MTLWMYKWHCLVSDRLIAMFPGPLEITGNVLSDLFLERKMNCSSTSEA